MIIYSWPLFNFILCHNCIDEFFMLETWKASWNSDELETLCVVPIIMDYHPSVFGYLCVEGYWCGESWSAAACA